MKYAFTILLLLCGIALSANAQSKSKTETLVIKSQFYCDHCLECGSCAGNINVAMAGLYGIKKVKINPTENNITIIYNPNKVSPEKMREAISNAGFDADNVKANPTAVSKLDDCCRKK